MESNEEKTMKRKDYIFVGLYVLLLGGWISTVIDRVDEEKEQFTKINKLNNDLIKISNYVSNNSKLLTSLEGEVYNNSLTLEDVSERLQEQYKTNTTFYEMYFSTQPQRVEKEEEELVEEKVSNEERVLETIEQEEVVVPVEVPVVKITTASSCPTPHTRLLPYIKRVTLRRDYKFVAHYDVLDSKIVNLSFTKKLPSKLQTALTKYLNSFKMNGNINGCYLPIKILGE